MRKKEKLKGNKKQLQNKFCYDITIMLAEEKGGEKT